MQYFIVSNYYYSPRAQRMCEIYGVKINARFTMKCMLKGSSLKVIIFLFSTNLFVGGFLVRIWERHGIKVPNYSFDNYLYCVYYTFITMSTVGYGDFYVYSFIGQLIIMIIVIYGIFINSIVTVILTDYFNFQGGEMKAYKILKIVNLRENLTNISKKLLIKSMLILFYKKKKRNEIKPKNIKTLVKKLSILNSKKLSLLKQVDVCKSELIDAEDVEFNDLIVDKLMNALKVISYSRDQVAELDEIVNSKGENQRNLNTLKYSILYSSDYN